VPQGCVYGFLGPNGAGKTTLLKMLTGLTKPDSGKMYILDEEVVFGKSVSNKFGFLPDVPNFYNWMTAKEFLNFSGGLYQIDNVVLKKRIMKYSIW